jgi:hypothetical protein
MYGYAVRVKSGCNALKINEMRFVPDKSFPSLRAAFDFIFERYCSRSNVVSSEAPAYLFRGENGQYRETVAAVSRSQSYALPDGRPLSQSDMEYLRHLMLGLHQGFKDDGYSLADHAATGLLQHYGLPTFMIDFTAHVGHALTFAATGKHDIARIAVVPGRFRDSAEAFVVDLRKHEWVERPRRQKGLGVVMPTSMPDLKSEAARSLLNVSWYEFPITSTNREELRENYRQITSVDDDPCAAFLRFHITEYVEENCKMSETLADWLLERIPIAPRLCQVVGFHAGQPVVHFRPPIEVPDFDKSVERDYSRRYWSAGGACSRDRMTNWAWPPEGSTVADPRTYHADLGTGRAR